MTTAPPHPPSPPPPPPQKKTHTYEMCSLEATNICFSFKKTSTLWKDIPSCETAVMGLTIKINTLHIYTKGSYSLTASFHTPASTIAILWVLYWTVFLSVISCYLFFFFFFLDDYISVILVQKSSTEDHEWLFFLWFLFNTQISRDNVLFTQAPSISLQNPSSKTLA